MRTEETTSSSLRVCVCVWSQSDHLTRPSSSSSYQDVCEHSTGFSSRSGVLSPGSLLASQSGEILGVARETAQAKAGCSQNACGVEDVLQLLRILYIIGGDAASNTRTMQEGRWRPEVRGQRGGTAQEPFSLHVFSASRLRGAAVQRVSGGVHQQEDHHQDPPADRGFPTRPACSSQLSFSPADVFFRLQEPLALASGALPDWCEQLTAKCPFLIPFETRQLYFTCTAFGASR